MVTKHTKSYSGFTLIELLVVMAIIATLLTIALPRYFHSVDRSKEQVLKTNLNTMRDAIDKYYADKGHYPVSLDDLASGQYLKAIPIDPMTESNTTWVGIASKDANEAGVADVQSGAQGIASDNTSYSEW